MKPAVLAAVNKQINHEQANAHAYLAASLYFGAQNMHGFEAFMAKQVADEQEHARKLIAHLMDRGEKVELAAIAAPKAEFSSPLEAAQAALALERKTTELIQKLYELARKEGDAALEVLLHWFITEQVEEEQWASELVAVIEQVGKHAPAMYMLDHRWGKKVEE